MINTEKVKEILRNPPQNEIQKIKPSESYFTVSNLITYNIIFY